METAERTGGTRVAPITYDGATVEDEFHPSIQTRRTDAVVRISKTGRAIGDHHRPFLWFVDKSTESGRRVVPVAIAQPTWQEDLVGSVRRTFSGDVRSGIRRRMRRFHIVTPMLPYVDANPLIDFLRQPGPLQVSGRVFTLVRAGGDPFPCHIGVMSGGYNRGGRIGGRVGELGADQRHLVNIEFDIIPESK